MYIIKVALLDSMDMKPTAHDIQTDLTFMCILYMLIF